MGHRHRLLINGTLLGSSVCLAILGGLCVQSGVAAPPTLPAASQPAATQRAASQPTSRPVAQTFVPFVITDDPSYIGGEVYRGIMPKGWTVKCNVVWTIEDAFPAQFRFHWSDAEDLCALDDYPEIYCYWDATMARIRREPGARKLGELIAKPPADQFDAIARWIKLFRPDLLKAKPVEKKDAPEWAEKALKSTPRIPNNTYTVKAGFAALEYELKGQKVIEQVGLVYLRIDNKQLGYTQWRAQEVISNRAPEAMLPQLAVYRATMIKGMKFNILWWNKYNQFLLARQKTSMDILKDQAKRQQLINSFNTKITDETQRQFDKFNEDSDRNADRQSDLMRGVSPWKTADGGTVKLPSEYGQAWQGSNGEIHMNNDPLYDPNSDPGRNQATWTRIEEQK